MEHAVILVCIQTKLQTVLCYIYTGDVTFITSFLKAIMEYIWPQGHPPPMKNSWCALMFYIPIVGPSNDTW